MRIRGYGRIKKIVEDRRARRFIASLSRAPYVPPNDAIERLRTKLESILDENILPFWFPGCLDREYGGYLTECSVSGEWKQNRTKILVSQARILWFASRLISFGRISGDELRWARHGVQFLRDCLLDKEHGGFYWQVDGKNRQPTMQDKHLYGQAYALYALSEFALATGDVEAREMAHDLFEVIDEHAHDPSHGGYHEFFKRDWNQPDPDESSYMGYPPDVKQLNTHVHLLEAFTRYLNLANSERIRTRLTELIQIQGSTVVNKHGGGCTDVFSTEWKRYRGKKFERVIYGHDVENVWMLIEANRALGVSNAPFMELYKQLFLNAVRYGWDVPHSGFYFRGQQARPANRRDKVWWVQAEAMLCALHLYSLTGQAVYFRIFSRTLDWIDRYQIDWSGGEWHQYIDISGAPRGGKTSDLAGVWKTPYHNGRAAIHCLELLDSLPAR